MTQRRRIFLIVSLLMGVLIFAVAYPVVAGAGAVASY